MAQDKMFACEECTEGFVVAGSLYACPDWVLRCPCCGSTSVLSITDAALDPTTDEAA